MNSELEVWLSASEAHATIRNFENQELCRLQGAEKTGMGKKRKINMEGCIITPLNDAALFAQQDTECWEKEAANEAKKKSKTDAMLAREHQHVLTLGTKVFANPLSSYNHKDDIIDIAAALGLDYAGTIPVLTEHILTYLVTHPNVTSQPQFSGLMKARKTHKCTHTDAEAPSQDQAGPSGSNYST